MGVSSTHFLKELRASSEVCEGVSVRSCVTVEDKCCFVSMQLGVQLQLEEGLEESRVNLHRKPSLCYEMS